MKPLSVPLATLAWSPGDRTGLSVVGVYAVLAGASFIIVLFTGLLAFWLNRRARRARRLERTPVPRPRPPAAVPPAAVPAAAVPPVPAARFEATIDLDRHRGNGNGRAPAPVRTDASGEYALLRAAAARAATVAAQAKHTLVEAASTLDTAERVYEEARRAHKESLAAAPATTPAADGDEPRANEFETAEIRARHQYHVALAHARAARQAEYVADTAVRALGAEAAAAAAELAAEHESGNGNGRLRRWRRTTSTPAPAQARPDSTNHVAR